MQTLDNGSDNFQDGENEKLYGGPPRSLLPTDSKIMEETGIQKV